MKKPYLADPKEARRVLGAHDTQARKKYGQNFLIDESVLMGIVDAADLSRDDFVVEIGPGIGTLTQYLSVAAGHVCAVEIDAKLLPVLEETLSGFGNVRVIHADILKTDLMALAQEENGGRPFKVCANLPYYITTPILMELLKSRAPITQMTVMVQKEVADRMLAGPGNKEYGALTLAVQYYTEPKMNFIVHPHSFLPQPGVDSAVVTLKLREEPPFPVKDENMLFDLIRASFNQRRKKLTNGIVNFAKFDFTKEEAEAALASCGMKADIRGEALSLVEFGRLADALADLR
ncbi:MAG: 16S rRNA (adenine(1518)-N(6)/adenine(1519)-N(6))-dimethyltransferase RsmA [Lachnospiraceae bacterium]|nr:16S rRNA (adenine(1518)-N(6)/adenine(1519)-N(6))-dimethyltransferase RsmA [Lachnospiraceae bacterium]